MIFIEVNILVTSYRFNHLKIFLDSSFKSQSHSTKSTSTEIYEATTSSQTPGYLSLRTPRKVILKKRLHEAHQTIKKLETSIDHLTYCLNQSDTVKNVLRMVKKCVSPFLYVVVKNNILNKDKTPQGRRFCNYIKQFALTIYFLGPNVFHFLQNKFCVPTIRTLRKIIS